MGTLLFCSYPALAELDESEARFLSTLVTDAVRSARRTGRYRGHFQRYRLEAWREPLGGRLCAVTWRVDRDDAPLARDTAIQFV
jgi:hypothetical protein